RAARCVCCVVRSVLRPPPLSPLFPYTTLFRSSRGLPFFCLGPSLRPSAASDSRRGAARRRPQIVAVHPGDHLDRDLLRARLAARSEEHTSELQSRFDLVCRLPLEKKKETSSIR